MAIQIFPNEPNPTKGANIKCVGVGGGGGNIINSMIEKGIEGIEFIAINTDVQALKHNKANKKIQIGRALTGGLGAGMDHSIGAKAAEESREEIEKALRNADMVFLSAGMGGGTGTGASPIVAQIAKNMGALVVAIVTKPFISEGKPKMRLAEEGLKNLKPQVDSLIVVPNENIFKLIDKNTIRSEAMDHVNRVLYNATKGISQIITKPGEVNVDFADVKTIMRGMGDAMIGMGIASGENRAKEAALSALSNPILDNINITGAKSVLVNILSNGNITMNEIETINKTILEITGDDVIFISGWADDNKMKDEIMVTVIATGFNSSNEISENEDILTSNAQTGRRVIIDTTFKSDRVETNITRIPATDKELEELDTPTFKRHNININDDLSESEFDDEKIDKEKITFDDIEDLENYKSPEFLRRKIQ